MPMPTSSPSASLSVSPGNTGAITRSIPYHEVESNLKRLQGEIMTVLEATLRDTQLSAAKELVRGQINRRMDILRNGVPNGSLSSD